jgi:hypothetical protein
MFIQGIYEKFSEIQKNSTKILKRKRDFRDFRYRYALPQKIKNVLTYYEYIFDFLKKSVPITEIPEIPFPFQDFHWKMHEYYVI